MWYAVKVRSQKEFEVEAELVEMGIDVWLPRRKQFVRSGTDRMPKAVVSAYIPGFMFVDIPPAVYRSVIEIKWVSPRMLPVIGIETANAKNTDAGVRELGSLGQMRTLRREVEAEFAEATRIEEAANAEWERSGNRKSYMEVVKQYRTGQAIQAIDGVFRGHILRFAGISEETGEAFPRIIGEVEVMGAPRRVYLDPLNVKAAE